MTPADLADLREYSKYVGRTDDPAEVTKADLAAMLDLIDKANARADDAEAQVARVRAALPPCNRMLDYAVPAIDVLRALDGPA